MSSVELSLTVPREHVDEVASELRRRGGEVLVVSSRGFDGAALVDIVVTLTPSLAAVLAGIYASRVRANQHVSLKMKGIEVKGVSEATLLKILDRTGPKPPNG